MRRIATHPATCRPQALSDGTLPGLIDLGAQRMAESTLRIEQQLGTCRDAAGLERLVEEIETLAERVESSTRLLTLLDRPEGLPRHARDALDHARRHALAAIDRAGRRAQAVADDAWILLQAPTRRRA